MNIEHLRYVIEVDRAGSISQAADNLYMGQPNLSKAIKELEQVLNIQIFRRTPKGTKITPKGREFLKYAKNILREYEELEALGRDGDEEAQALRVSVPRASYIVDAFTTFLCSLDMEKPIQMDFLETNAIRAIRNVTNRKSGFGIIRFKSEYKNYFTSLLQDSGLVWRPLLRFRYLLLMSKNHPLAGRDIVDAQDLHPFIEVFHGDTAIPHMPDSMPETERGTTPGDKKVQVYERGSQFDILSRVPGTYMWVSPMPQDLLERNGLVQNSCRQSPDFNDFLIYQDGHRFSSMEEEFVNLLEISVSQILSSVKE